MDCGKALIEIQEKKLWRTGKWETWEDYCREVAGLSKSYASRIINATRLASDLCEKLPIGNSQTIAPGTRIIARDEEWLVRRMERNSAGDEVLIVAGLSELVRDREARFIRHRRSGCRQCRSRPCKDPSPTGGLVHCACGGTMTIVNPLLKFVCSQCQTRILVVELEKIFLRDLEAFVTIHGAAVTALMSVDVRDEDLFRERRQVTEEQEKLGKEIAKVQQQVLDGKVTSAKFPALLKPLEIQRKALRSKAKKLEVQSSQKNDGKAGAEPAPASSLDFVTKVWPQLPLKFQQKITRSFVKRYVISPGRVLIRMIENPSLLR